MIWLVVKYILAAAARDKILISFLLFMAVGISLSVFLGSAAVTEKDQFSIVFAASALRLGSLFTLVLFTVFYIRKSFDTRDVEYMLTKPINRLQFLTGNALAFTLLSFIIAALSSIIIFLMPISGDIEGTLTWSLSLFIELVLMSNIALFFSFVLTSAVSATLMSLAFYSLARMIGGILGVIAAETQTGAMLLMEKIMLVISIIIPRLDLMGQGSWLLYGVQDGVNWVFIITQGIVFLGFIFSATLIDFKRKQF